MGDCLDATEPMGNNCFVVFVNLVFLSVSYCSWVGWPAGLTILMCSNGGDMVHRGKVVERLLACFFVGGVKSGVVHCNPARIDHCFSSTNVYPQYYLISSM